MAISTTFTLKFAGAAVERGLSRVKSAFKSLGGVAMRIGKSLISPFAGIAAAAGGLLAARALIRTAIELNAIGEAGRAGDKALANVTKQMGLFGNEADDVTKRLIDYADVVSRSNGVDGESIGIAQTKLMTFKELANSADIAGGAFDRATMAAIDMASAGFGSAETNAVQLGKALNDPIKGINSLTRSGITFTAQEKAKIATLVESNQMLKAQDIILKAIETQVGGTAEASATSSGKIKASFQQIKDAFAEPMSMGVDSIPGALESVFPKIIAKAEELGKLIGKTIADAVNGDFTRFFMIGSMIGDLIKEGLKFSLRGLTDTAGQSLLDYISTGSKFDPISAYAREEKLSKKHRIGAKYQMQVEIKKSARMLSEKYAEALALPDASARDLGRVPGMPVPGYPKYEYASPGKESDALIYGHAVRLIESIDRKLSPQP